MFCDTHFHFEIGDNEDLILNNARRYGVSMFFLAGTNKQDNIDNLIVSLNNEDVYVCCGYHPSEALEITHEDICMLKELILKNKNKVILCI